MSSHSFLARSLLPFEGRTALLFATACLCMQANADPRAPLAAPHSALAISVVAARQMSWSKTLKASGSVAPWQEAVASARNSGLSITAILVDTGSRVRKGDVLARLDDRSARADVAQALATLAEAAATERQSVANRDRSVAMGKVQAISEQDVLQASTLAETDKARREIAAAALESARVRLENTEVKAPDDGTVTSRTAVLGQVSAAGSELFRLLRQNRLEWRAEMTSQQAASARASQSAVVTLPDGTTVRGRVRLIAPSIDAASHLFLIYVQLEPDEGLRSGMVVSGQILLGEAPAIVVPAGCVLVRDGHTYVFRVEGRRARRVSVVTGRTEGEVVEITSGLAPGQLLALRGAGFLADDDAVDVVENKGVPQP